MALGYGVLAGMVQYVLWQWAQGNTDTLLNPLLQANGSVTGLHDTYYVISHFRFYAKLAIPGLVVGALLLGIAAHPRRTKIDIGLFWLCAALFFGSSLTVALIFGSGLSGMPRRYIDDTSSLELAHSLGGLMAVFAYITALIAAARPIWSWWRARRQA